MAQDDAPKAGPEGEKSGEGFSQFFAKVLDQLSISAWLPAVMLVGNAAVLLQLNRQPNLNVGEAIATLTKSPLGILIVVLFAIVLATMVAQAFSFEVIRLLEGYWGQDPADLMAHNLAYQAPLSPGVPTPGPAEPLPGACVRCRQSGNVEEKVATADHPDT